MAGESCVSGHMWGQPLNMYDGPTAHSPGHFKALGEDAAQGKGDRSWASNGRFWILVELSSPAGCTWTVAPTSLGLSVPICTMGRED